MFKKQVTLIFKRQEIIKNKFKSSLPKGQNLRLDKRSTSFSDTILLCVNEWCESLAVKRNIT